MSTPIHAVVNAVNQYVQNGTFDIPVEFGVDLFAANFVPYAQMEYDRIRKTNTNHVVIPRGFRWEDTDVKTSVDLSANIQPTQGAGGSDDVPLDQTLAIAKVYYHKELAAWGEDVFSQFNLGEAKRICETKVEKAAITKINTVSTANFGEDIVSVNNKIDAFQTMLKISKKLSLKGILPHRIICYIAPAFYMDLMTNGVIIANGQSEIQSRDVREGLGSMFRIIGCYVKQDPIVPSITGKNSESQTNDTPALMVISPVDNIWFFYNEWAPLALVPVPAAMRYNAIQMNYFVYFGFYVKDPSVSGVIFELENA